MDRRKLHQLQAERDAAMAALKEAAGMEPEFSEALKRFMYLNEAIYKMLAEEE
jgi:hypothetical protein